VRKKENMYKHSRFVYAGLLFLVLLFLFVLVSDNSEADEIDVDSFGGADYTSLSDAVSNANPEDTINVAARTYIDTVLIDKQLTILGANEGSGKDAGNIFGASCDSGNLVTRYKLDETSGSDASDEISCDDLDGDVSGASWETGVWGNGLDFDGSDYVKVDYGSAFDDITTAISISAWVNLDDNETTQTIVSNYNQQSDTDRDGFRFLITHQGYPEFVFGMGSSSGSCDAAVALSENTWYHLVVTYGEDSSDPITFYINSEKASNTCNYSTEISPSSADLIIGATDENDDDSYETYFDGTIDDVMIWNSILSSSTIEALHWSGDGSYYPIIDADEGDYSFKVTADDVLIRKFEVYDAGDDNTDAGIFVDGADDVTIVKIISKSNRVGISVADSDDVKIHTVTINCDSHDRGLKITSSDNIEVAWGSYDCATVEGIYSENSKNGIYHNFTLDDNEVGIHFFSSTNVPNAHSSNQINSVNIADSDSSGIKFNGADNNILYDVTLDDNKYGISFGWNADDNILNDVDFVNSEDYDIYHFGCGVSDNENPDNTGKRYFCGGWDNVLIDTTFGEDLLSINASSRLLVKELLETEATGNETYAWNRVNTTIDDDRRTSSGTNSFWIGYSGNDKYADNWNENFSMNTDVSLPSGGVEENRILEIKTWYETEDTFDGGRVYISKDSGTTWNLLTPIGGYDSNLQATCDFDGGAFNGDDEDAWQTKKFNLSGYRGEDIRIKFNFCSDGSQTEEGWYIDDVKIFKESDSSNVLYFDDFERAGHKWLFAGDWTTSNAPSYYGVNGVDVLVTDETRGESLLNITYNSNLKNHWKFDESSDCVTCYTYDSITNYNARLYGATFTSGKFGNAISFDGDNDYVQSNNDMHSGRYTQLTISAWVKFDSFPSSGNYESLVNPRYDGDAFLQVDSDGKPIFGGYFYNPNGEQRVVGTTTMFTGVWYHLVGTWSEYSDKMHIYVNGTLEKEKSMSSNNLYLRTSYYNYFGRDYNGNYMDGTLDQVSLWAVVLTSAEIQTLYNSPNGGDHIYATPYFGGSDSKTNNQGKIQDLYFTTKFYSNLDNDGDYEETSVDSYGGLKFGSLLKKPSTTNIISNKLEVRLPPENIFNRNSNNLFRFIQDAVDGAADSDVLEVWPGTYKENIEIDKRLTILGSGASNTILDGRYLGSVIKLKGNADYTIIKNLTVKRSGNNTHTCNTGSQHAGIDAYQAYNLKIHHVNFKDNEYGFNGCYVDYVEILYSYIDAAARRGSAQAGIFTQSADYGNYRYNEIINHSRGIQINSNSHYSKIFNNKIHNNTSTGITGSSLSDGEYYNNVIIYNNGDGIYSSYAYRSKFVNNTLFDNNGDGIDLQYGYSVRITGNTIKESTSYGLHLYRFSASTSSLKSVIENNIFTKNNYGVYSNGYYSTSYSKYLEFYNNTFNTSGTYGLYCYYYCYDIIVENNTFIGGDDTVYGLYLQKSYYGIIGNNTFHNDHTSKDIYMYQCGSSSTTYNKFFNNNFSTILVSSSCDVQVYDNLNVKTVETDSDPFSGVHIMLNDTSSTFYKTSHWEGGTDSVTDTDGFISSGTLLKSGSYLSSSTFTNNTITCSYAYGVRAKTFTFNFSGDTLKTIEVPDNFRIGVVENENTDVLYTTITSAINEASTNDVLKVWNWTFNEAVVVNKGVTLVGNSTTSSIINGTTEDYSIEIKSNGVTIKNLRLEGSTDSVIYAGNYHSLNISDVFIVETNSDVGLTFVGTESSTITDVTVNNTDRKSVVIENGDGLTFKNSNFKNSSSSHGFEIEDSDEITLDNIFIHNPGYSGSSSYGITISSSSTITIKNSSKIADSKSYTLYVDDVSTLVVQDSIFVGKELARIDESNNFLIENSKFKGNSQGDNSIFIKETDGGTFRNNVITNPSSDADSPENGAIFLSDSDSNLIKNNTVTNSGRSGIHLKAGSLNNQIIENDVTGSYTFGLLVQGSDGTIIRNNTFSSSNIHGIKIASSDDVVVDNNTLNTNTKDGLYLSSSDDAIVKYNSISENEVGIYVTASDDSLFLFNDIDDNSNYGAQFQESKNIRFKLNTIKNTDSDALFLSMNSDNAFIDNNTIKNNGVTTSGRSIRLSEVDDSVIYNNTIKSNTYNGIFLVSSSTNKIIQNTIDDSGAYGIQINNDASVSDNNTIKDNLIKSSDDSGISSQGMFTKIINNTIKFNVEDGIYLDSSAARSIISSNIVEDNEDNALHILSNNVLITKNEIDGDTSNVAVYVSNANNVNITHNVIEGGSQGIKIVTGLNSYIFNNTIESNSDYGLYLLTNSSSSIVLNNTLQENGDYALYVQSSDSVKVIGNTLKDNDDYAMVLADSKLINLKTNTIADNSGGVKYNNCDYCNITSTEITDNSIRGLWLLGGSDNNFFANVEVSENGKDLYFQSSTGNKGFNFSFSTVTFDSSSVLVLTSNLNIAFQSSNGSAFEGVEFELLSGDVQYYATPFYGGTDSVSDSNGEVSETFALDYKIYNGSSTSEDIPNNLTYHYGVRSKSKSLDMSSSHTETITVNASWIYGYVLNINTDKNWTKIQDAIDNSSSGDTIHIWAWTYSENVEVDESITIIGNGTRNTTINASSNGKGFDITSDDVTIKNIEVISCGSTEGHNGIQIGGEDAIIEHIKVSRCFNGISVEGSGVWIANSTFTSNYDFGINVYQGSSSSDAVKVYNNVISWNTKGGVRSVEDDTVIKSNLIHNNSGGSGIYFEDADDSVIENNTIIDNLFNIKYFNNAVRVLIKNNVISGSDNQGIYVGSNANYGVIEGNTITDSGSVGIFVQSSDYYYLGNNTVSGSGNYDIKFDKASIGNSAKNTTFSTILVHPNAYFAIYNDLSLTLVDTSDVGFEGADIKVVNDDDVLYSTNHYGGTDNKTDSNGKITKNFTLIFEIYDGSSTPETIPTNISTRYLDWDVTSSLEPSASLKIIVPDFRVQNSRTGVLTYHIQTSIDDAQSGDTLYAWAGNYYENIEVDKILTIQGNGSATVIDGTFTEDTIEITSGSVVIKNLVVVSGSNDENEAGISVIESNNVIISNIKFINNTISVYVEDSEDLVVNQSTFDVLDYGVYAKGTSTRLVVEDNAFRNGTSGNACIYQLSSDGNGNALISDNSFDDCHTAWKSGSNDNTFRDNTLNDNTNGIQLNGEEAKNNLVDSNTISDSASYGLRIYASAEDNNIFNTIIQDSSISDIKLSDSDDTVLVNTTFSDLSVSSDANMWIKVYLDFGVYDNSSNSFEGADVKIMEDASTLYSTDGFGGSDPKTDGNGSIGIFLVATKHYDGSSTPENVTTNITVEYVDWISTETYDVTDSISVSIDDFRVQNQNTGVMYYSISGAISAVTSYDATIHVWPGTYREKITINKQITLVGNSTANTILNGSAVLGDFVTISSENVILKNLSFVSAQTAIDINSDNCEVQNVYVANNNVTGIYTGASFIKIIDSEFKNNGQRGIELQGASEISVINNTFVGTSSRGINIYQSDDVVIRNNLISSDGIGIISTDSNDIEIFNNKLHNNSNDGLIFDGDSSNSEAYNNSIEYNEGYGISVSGADSLLIRDNVVKSNTKGFRIIAADDIVFLSNTFISNDDGLSELLPWGGTSGHNRLENNIFDDTGLVIEASNQTLIGNTFQNSPGYGIKLNSEYCDNNVFYHNVITNSNDEDIFVGGSGNQTNNVGYNNTFSTIEVESNGEFIILDYVNVKTVNASGDMPDIDVHSYYRTSSYYQTSYFGGSDDLTNETGEVPMFIAPIVYYGGSSTADNVLLPVEVRYVDFVETFFLDYADGDSITIDIPDLRVKNVDTDEMSYHIQTAIDNANVDDRIYVMQGIYHENVLLNKKLILASCLPEDYGSCYRDGTVLIDAKQSGSGIKITANGAKVRGLSVTNSSGWPEAGIRVVADAIEIWGSGIFNCPIGILYQDATLTGLLTTYIFGVDIGIWLTSSSYNDLQTTHIYDTNVTDIWFDSYGYSSSEGSENNTLQRMQISKINFTNSPNNRIIWPENENYYQLDKVTLVNSENIVSVGYDDPADIEIDSDSSYFVKNQVNIHVMQNETALSDVDVKFWNDTEIFYATSLYGGSDSKTVAGTMLSSVEFAFKEYIGSSVGTDNSIKIEITHIDFVNKTTLSGSDGYPEFCYQCTIYADFDIPIFRVYNENSGNGYYYLQSAIDSANSGDKLLVYSGAYHENIVVDKSLTIEGQGVVAPIVIGDIDNPGFGSPPLVEEDGVGIEITADNVEISNIRISNFSTGINISAGNAFIHNVEISDISTNAIVVHTAGAESIISGSQFSNNGLNNNEASIWFRNSDSVQIRDNIFTGPRGIFVEGSNNKIINNSFTNINNDAVSIRSGDNNIYDSNQFENTDIAYYYDSSGINNLVVNNSYFVNTRLDLYVHAIGLDNNFINNQFTNIDNPNDVFFELSNVINLQMKTVNGPANNVQLEILEGESSIYATPYYSGSSPKTDGDGRIAPIIVVYERCEFLCTNIDSKVNYYYDSVEYNVSLDTSSSHDEVIWVNVRPEAIIDSFIALGDLTTTTGIEAVKGADINITDSYTVAYWPFDEGQGSDVYDEVSSQSGKIRPTSIWNAGNSNLSSDYSLGFEGTYTNLELVSFQLTEFTGEMWFKTTDTKTMTLFSDKKLAANGWGYHFYISGEEQTLNFDFTTNGGNVQSLTSSKAVNDGNWHFGAIVRSSDKIQLWLDNDLVAETSWSGVVDFTDEPLTVGQTPAGSESFKGSIDDFRISNIARHNEDLMNGGGIVELISTSYDIDGTISEHIWVSLIDGELGRGQTLYYPVDNLTQGTHTIQLTVVDNNGTTSNPVSSVLLVMERPVSVVDSVKINGESIWSGWGPIQVNSGDSLSLVGGSIGEQTITEFHWESDQDGVLCIGNSIQCSTFTTNTLSNGTHQLSLKVKGGNGLWSSDYILTFDVNGRPVIGTPEVTDDSIARMRSAAFSVRIDDDSTEPENLEYTVGYRIKGSEAEWGTDYIDDVLYNSDTEELEFTFNPDEFAPTGEYEFYIEAKDEEDATLVVGETNYYVIGQTVSVKNNEPVIEKQNVPLEFKQGSPISLDVSTSDEDGVVSTVIWYADDVEIGTGANFSFEENNLAPGNHTIKVRVLDNDGGYSEQTFEVFVTEAEVEESTVSAILTDFSNNLPLFALLAFGLIMVVGTVLLRRNRSASGVAEGPTVDDGTKDTFVAPPGEILDWDIPTDAQGNALIIGEYMAKRRESYLTHPNNEEVVDYLHNNRERFAISSYFDVPGDPTVVVNDWALPENLRGNVHLDSFRQQIVERITNSTPDKNFVIIGEPGVGKTVMLFEVFDRLMNKAPVGILSTDTIAKAHEMFGVRVFYDDIPENQKLVDALTENDIQGVIVSSREADWKALPTEMQAKFDRLTVPLFSELDMKAMIKKMMTFQSIGYNDDSVDILAEYAEGSPIYVWSMVREMMHRSVKTLTKEYIQENSVKGMINYVAQLLQRLLKDGEEYRKGGLHALASLIFLSDHMEERYCNDYFFDAYVEVLSKHTEEKLDDKMNPKTLNLVLAYLPINESVIRFPHDTWPDVLQGWGDMNPFSTELRMINRAFADSGTFQDLKKEVVADVWNSTYERYKRTPSRQKNSFLALADTLFQNFTIDELKELGVDIDVVRQVASTYSHIPQAAKLISKIQAVLPQTVTRIINMQDISSEQSHAPYKIQEMYLIYNDGRMITSLMDEEAKVDSDIMSSMLTAINDFVKDSFQTTGNLGSIDYGENQIILERGKYTILASVVYGEANRDLRSRMSRSLTKIEETFGSNLKSWNGDVDSLSGTTEYLQPIMDISKSVTKDMIDELQALKSINLRSSWTQVAGYVQVNLLINNYSKKQIKGAKLTLEYGTDFLKLVKTEPEFKYKVTEVDIKKVPGNDEMPVTLYFEPLKSAQASLNVHLDYEAKGGNASGVSSAVFERVNLFKEGQSLNISDLDNAQKAEIIPESAPVETVGDGVEVLESGVEVMDTEIEDAPSFETAEEPKEEEPKKEEPKEKEPEEPAIDPGESGVDDLMSKLDELDDSSDDTKEKKAKKDKKEKKSDDDDEADMDDLLGKLDEL